MDAEKKSLDLRHLHLFIFSDPYPAARQNKGALVF